MTAKQYRTAMGKVVDLGALMLQNENVRAVGNMNVNARGDRLNSTNQIIDKKPAQINRQQKKQVSNQLAPTKSNAELKRTRAAEDIPVDPADTFSDLPDDQEPVDIQATTEPTAEPPARKSKPNLEGGLAAAIAKARTVQQSKLPTPREMARQHGVRKL